ncbi:MAG: hypothetical protein II909_04955 [Kiritimatiellae bacterium]|nr:hypothetical protein [Kiritimatiellia bacterium]
MEWYVKSPDGAVFGPADIEKLKAWADESRISPEHVVSEDKQTWTPVSRLAELEMVYLVEVAPGDIFGPFTRKVVDSLIEGGQLPADARVYVTAEELAAALEEVKNLRDGLEAAQVALAAAVREGEQLAAKLAEKESCIVIDPEVLDPAEEEPQTKVTRGAPPKVSPLDGQAILEARLRNELIRARQKGVDFSFLKRR